MKYKIVMNFTTIADGNLAYHVGDVKENVDKNRELLAKKLGYEYSVLIGHPTYYPRLGYVDAANFGITAPFDLPEGVFMAINLQGKNTMLNATIEYAKEFLV